ncbi:pyrimidine-specific ribonucleoside hydrolase RihA-like isoform X2 [Pecten maximus]|uniref:pyrimidine-specific ribonucleoside hydrolase RihA-like isoform X2 n=1 Tax=Pecten maximus TaxID=6579 RepID=UPI001458797A|nr:pyrimidine-specific ribonucleoside hydrolase RihA-like isoform X2 [Pecten maximus]
MSTQRKMLIIDTDGGIDDAQAIFMMLDSTEYDVIALTCVRGNSGVEQVVCNVLKILRAADKLNIPVFPGTAFSILGQKEIKNSYQGDDGLGDCPSIEEPDVSIVQKEAATDAIIRLTKEHPGEITLMCIGPLTNLATALKMDPDFGSRLRDCFIMGGNYYGKGNITVSAEFNFHSDPEAAYIALEQVRCPTTLVGWEVCEENGPTWDQYHELRRFPGKRNKFLKAIEQKPVAYSIEQGWNYSPADEFLAACMLCPSEVVLETKHVYATVELGGKFTYGQMVVDWNKVLKKNPNLTIVTKIDKKAFYTVLLNTAKNGL